MRELGPMTPAEIERRIEEERRPLAGGLLGQPAATFRLRDDIWLSVSADRTEVPREELPERCPACRQADTLLKRGLVE